MGDPGRRLQVAVLNSVPGKVPLEQTLEGGEGASQAAIWEKDIIPAERMASAKALRQEQTGAIQELHKAQGSWSRLGEGGVHGRQGRGVTRQRGKPAKCSELRTDGSRGGTGADSNVKIPLATGWEFLFFPKKGWQTWLSFTRGLGSM